MNILNLVVGLISGAVGGNLAGALMKNSSFGPLGNSLAGIVGGGLTSALIPELGMSAAAASGLGGVLTNVAAGGVGGAILMAVAGLFKATFTAKN
jgi:uncharacterized membrane protein YeaQ/YmgE (transglycosylase-associated protein family)